MRSLIFIFIFLALLVIIITVITVVLLTIKKRSQIENTSDEYKPWPLGVNANFLSAAEQSFFGVLVQLVGEHYVVCPKVSLSDVIFIHKGTDNSTRQSLFNRISRKHLDFVLLDKKTLTPAFAIELDDSSHQNSNVKMRDTVKDKALSDAGLKLIRVPAKYTYTINDLEDVFPADILSRNESEYVSQDEGQKDSNINNDDQTDQVIPFCPKCKVEMVERKASRGKHSGLAFWGCTNYPHCRETRQVSDEIIS